MSLESDAWLGALLGRPAFHLAAASDPAAFVVSAPAFIDAKSATSDVAKAAQLTDAGFRLIDTNVQLDRPAGAIPAITVDATVRPARTGDCPGVEAVAAESFRHDRFHADPAIPPAVADRIKAAWAANFFAGRRGDRMIVAAGRSAILGFLQILDRKDMSVIDLIAVTPAAQGQGIAGAMIAHAIATGPSAAWRVGTQIANAASLRLYARLGFRIVASQYVFHRHID